MDMLSEYNQSAIADILESKNVYEYYRSGLREICKNEELLKIAYYEKKEEKTLIK